MYVALYEAMIEAIDAHDNGILMSERQEAYAVDSHLVGRVCCLRLLSADDSATQEENFTKAMDLAKDDFHMMLNRICNIDLPSWKFTFHLVKSRFNFHKSGALLFNNGYHNITRQLHVIERALNANIKFIITGKESKWKMETVLDRETGHVKVDFPQAWWNTSGFALAVVSGFNEATFCSADGRWLGARSLDTLCQIAERLISESIARSNAVSLYEGIASVNLQSTSIALKLEKWDKLLDLAPKITAEIDLNRETN